MLTLPFPWRLALAQDGALLGALTRIFEDTLQEFYARRAREEGHLGGKTGCVTVVQRASSDLRLNSHLHAILLDGTWHEQDGELVFRPRRSSGVARARSREVAHPLLTDAEVASVPILPPVVRT